MKDSLDYALQAGVDLDFPRRFFVSIDVKYLDIDTTARLRTAGGTSRVDVSIDPIVFGIRL
jgi:outer membrane protein